MKLDDSITAPLRAALAEAEEQVARLRRALAVLEDDTAPAGKVRVLKRPGRKPGQRQPRWANSVAHILWDYAKEHGGELRLMDFKGARPEVSHKNINSAIYRMRLSGEIVEVSKDVYRVAGTPPPPATEG